MEGLTLNLCKVSKYLLMFLVSGVIIFKIGLLTVRAEDKTNMKWVLSSFFIQFALNLLITVPIALEKILAIGAGIPYDGPQTLLVVVTILLSVFIVVNLINVIHKVGITRSLIVLLFIVVPMVGATYFIYTGIRPFPV